ncbi:tetratricopeptide repeat protein [Limnospira fusiformis KN01]|uniref:tetratricopeptide repeat protein n=1 Tax=Limnospira fusiformis TaxID=54297 RepID=UPI001F412E5C|nr:tetratricopeptide repeat protein [Limnospira fusiformis]ULB45230.1 tetratricopeptide repeat protein [Limnospira fusiformis KN01]
MVSDLVRGNQLLRSGKLEEAVDAFQKAIAHHPNFHWSHYKLGEALEQLGRKAIKAIFKLSDEQSTIKLEPNYVWMTFEVHGEQIYQLKGKISSDSLGYNLALFQLQLLDGDKNIIEGPYEGFPLSPSAGYFKYIPISSPTMSEFLINIKTLPNTCYIKGGFRTWRTSDYPVYLESQLEILNCSELLQSGKLEEAVDAFQKAIALHPNFHWSHYKLGEALEKLGRWEEAKVAYHKAVDMNSSYYEFNLALGRVYQKLNEFDRALYYLRMACNNQPNIVHGYYQLAKLLVKLEQKGEETIGCYEKIIELKPEYFHKIYCSFGECLIKAKKFQRAVEIYQIAVKIEVMPAHAYNLFEYALIQQNRLDEAITVCDEAIKQIPSYAGSYWTLGDLYVRKQEYEKAVTVYRKCIEVNPNYRRDEIQKKLDFLENFSTIIAPVRQIWKCLNLPVINKNDQKDWPLIDQQKAYSAFAEDSSVRLIKISSMGANDLEFLNKLGIQAACLEDFKKYNLSNNLRQPLSFQITILEKGYVESICPYTGLKVKSQHSFYTSVTQKDNGVKMPLFYYRFVGKKVFYLVVGLHGGDLLAIYFPEDELCVCIAETASYYIDFNKLKSYFVSSWLNITNYLLNKRNKELSIVCGSDSHFGHTLLNEMSSYCYLTESEPNGWKNIKQILVLPDGFFDLTDFYPSLCSSKIIKHFQNDYNLFNYIALNHLLAMRVSNSSYLLSQKASNLIYFASVQKIDKTILKQIEEVKASLDLIWFEVRSNDRIWLNQAEGIAKIANHLYADLPNIGVIFAGWSYTHQDTPSDIEQIEKDRQVVQQSQDLMNPSIPTFAVVGNKIYEKIAWAGAAMLHIATYGSGHLFASIASKPLIIHANKGWYPSEGMTKTIINNVPYCSEELISVVPIQYIYDKDPSVHFWTRNYYCNWEGIYQEIVKLLNTLNQKA